MFWNVCKLTLIFRINIKESVNIGRLYKRVKSTIGLYIANVLTLLEKNDDKSHPTYHHIYIS